MKPPRQLLLPVALALLPFVHSMSGFQFVWEDPSYILRNKPIQSLCNVPRFFGLKYWNCDIPTPTRSYRPVREAALAVDYSLWGRHSAGYRFTSILLHALAAVCFYGLARSALGGVGRAGALLGACVFAVHPSRVETVVYAKNKAEILGALFVFVAAVLWDRATRDCERRGAGLGAYLGTLGLFVLALLSKATALALPAALVAGAWCRDRGRPSVMARRMAATLPLFAVAAVCVYANMTFIEKQTGLIGDLGRLSMRWRPALVTETWWGYLGMSFWPVNLHADRLLDAPGGPWWAWAVAFSGWCLLGSVCAWRLPRIAPTVAFGGAWFVLFLAPALNVLLIEGRPLADQRLYAPMAGLCLCAGAALGRSRVRRAWLMAGLAAFAALSCQRVFAWRSGYALWFDNVLCAPAKPKALNNLGLQYAKMGRYKTARSLFGKALKINAKFCDAMCNLAAICRERGELREANVWYSRALAIDPERLDTWMNAGTVFWDLGMYDLAEHAFTSLLQRKPDEAVAYNSLAGVYLQQKRYADAEARLRDAIRLDPTNSAFLVNLGQALDGQGRQAEAVACYKRALDLEPTNGLAHFKLGQMALRLKHYAEAKVAFEHAVRVQPGSWFAWYGLALVAQAQGDEAARARCMARVRELNPSALAPAKGPQP